jgi:hypothetical protein
VAKSRTLDSDAIPNSSSSVNARDINVYCDTRAHRWQRVSDVFLNGRDSRGVIRATCGVTRPNDVIVTSGRLVPLL